MKCAVNELSKGIKGVGRRGFLAASLTAAAAAPLLMTSAPAAEDSEGLVDCNVHLGPHPNRALEELGAGWLGRRGVVEAWAGSFEALLHRDVAGVNRRLVARCQGILRPVGMVHPHLPGWRDDLRRCLEVHGMRMIRLYPAHHGYGLGDPAFEEVLAAAAEAGLLVQVVVQMEDERTQNPLMRVPVLDLKPLSGVLKKQPLARVMLLNVKAPAVQAVLRGLENVWIDTAMIEGVGGVENLLSSWRADRLVLGSHAPFFYWEAARLKLEESILTAAQLAAIRRGNAAALLA